MQLLKKQIFAPSHIEIISGNLPGKEYLPMKKAYKKWIIYLLVVLFVCWLWNCTDVLSIFRDPIVLYFR
jgi:hypothetical protein